MGALSGQELKNRLTSKDLNKRLVVTPLLEPEEQLRADQASIDVRLGFDFALFSPSMYASIDEFGDSRFLAKPEALTTIYKRAYLPLGHCLLVHPHQFVLASSLEYLRLPRDLMAYVIGRSTWGRLGLIVATAVGVQPGFAGALTLELRNLGETPLSLYPGQLVAQLFFHDVINPPEGDGGLGQYSGVTDIVPKRLSSPKTREKIQKLIEKVGG